MQFGRHNFKPCTTHGSLCADKLIALAEKQTNLVREHLLLDLQFQSLGYERLFIFAEHFDLRVWTIKNRYGITAIFLVPIDIGHLRTQ